MMPWLHPEKPLFVRHPDYADAIAAAFKGCTRLDFDHDRHESALFFAELGERVRQGECEHCEAPATVVVEDVYTTHWLNVGFRKPLVASRRHLCPEHVRLLGPAPAWIKTVIRRYV